jgi:hypothetical protein
MREVIDSIIGDEDAAGVFLQLKGSGMGQGGMIRRYDTGNPSHYFYAFTTAIPRGQQAVPIEMIFPADAVLWIGLAPAEATVNPQQDSSVIIPS